MGGWLEEWKIMLKSASATTGTVLSLAISQPTKFQSLLIIITLKRLKILKKSNYSCHSFSIHALEFCFRIITLSWFLVQKVMIILTWIFFVPQFNFHSDRNIISNEYSLGSSCQNNISLMFRDLKSELEKFLNEETEEQTSITINHLLSGATTMKCQKSVKEVIGSSVGSDGWINWKTSCGWAEPNLSKARV